MSKHEPTDTYTAAARAVYARILAAGPALGLQPRRAADLRRMLDDGQVDCYTSPEFEAAGSNCTLTMSCDDRASWRAELAKDTAGNEFYEVKIKFEVNWPCHGSCDPATALARIAFYGRVAGLAAELHAEFGGGTYFRAGRTAAEIADQAAKVAAAKQTAAVKAVVDAHRKGLRIGQVTMVAAPEVAAIPAGTHRHTDGDKHFRLEVWPSGNGAALHRDECALAAPAPAADSEVR